MERVQQEMLRKLVAELKEIQGMMQDSKMRHLNVQKDCERFIKDGISKEHAAFEWIVK